MFRILVFLRGVDTFPIFGPAETTFLVELDQICCSLFSREVTDSLFV